MSLLDKLLTQLLIIIVQLVKIKELKFQSGVVHLVALLIIAIFPVLVGTGVYYTLKNSSDQQISAAVIKEPINAPDELSCDGQWKTIKPLGKTRAQALAGL